jgi:hypothetical protein
MPMVLAAVARQGSVTKAAKELRYSQPSVSHHLSRLEAATGVKLVQRVGRGIRLTPEVQLLASRATEIVGRVDAADQRAGGTGRSAGRPGSPGRQRVGAEHDRAEVRRNVDPGAPGTRAEFDRPSSARGVTGAATRRGRLRSAASACSYLARERSGPVAVTDESAWTGEAGPRLERHAS